MPLSSGLADRLPCRIAMVLVKSRFRLLTERPCAYKNYMSMHVNAYRPVQYKYIYIYIHMYVCVLYGYVCIYIHIDLGVSLFECDCLLTLCAHFCSRTYIPTCMHEYRHTYIRTYMRTNRQAIKHAYMHTCIHTYMCYLLRVYTHAVCIHAQAGMCLCIGLYMCSEVRTYVCLCMRVCISYLCMYVYVYVDSWMWLTPTPRVQLPNNHILSKILTYITTILKPST